MIWDWWRRRRRKRPATTIGVIREVHNDPGGLRVIIEMNSDPLSQEILDLIRGV